jgi:conjugative transfer region protein (TIGR03750 family)
MILHEINYKMPIYRDCTLGEILSIGTCVFLAEIIVFAFLTKLLFGYAAIGVVITFITFFHVTKFSLNQLQKVKYGKPYGYYKHLLVKKSIEFGLLSNRYLTRKCKWSVRRVR